MPAPLPPPLIASRLQVRLADESDLPALCDLHRQTYLPLPVMAGSTLEADNACNLVCFERNMAFDMKKTDYYTLLATRDGTPSAFILYHLQPPRVEIERLSALPGLPDSDEGAEMLQLFEARMRRRAFIRTVQASPPFHLLNMFKNAGYQFVARRTSLDMRKDLGKISVSLPDCRP